MQSTEKVFTCVECSGFLFSIEMTWFYWISLLGVVSCLPWAAAKAPACRLCQELYTEFGSSVLFISRGNCQLVCAVNAKQIYISRFCVPAFYISEDIPLRFLIRDSDFQCPLFFFAVLGKLKVISWRLRILTDFGGKRTQKAFYLFCSFPS